VYSAQLFYQRNGWQGSFGYHYTGTFLGGVGTTASEDGYVNRFRRMDAKLSYDVTSGVTVFGEVQNLNNEPLWNYQGKGRPDRTTSYTEFGRTAYVGARMSL
jgi:outer membrane receptor for ferrienterochelin and colicin